MPTPRSLRRATVLVAAAILTASCERTTGPQFGAIRIVASTTGDDLDPDGYQIEVDGSPGQAVVSNGSVVLAGVPTGRRTLRFAGAATNCQLDGATERSITVSRGDTVSVDFAVACVPRVGSLRVRVTTTGAIPDPDGYRITVGTRSLTVGVNDSVLFADLREGVHTATLDEAERNCNVQRVKTVSITFANVTSVTYTVTCGPITGGVRVQVATTGTELDPNGYGIQVQGQLVANLGINGAAVLLLAPGDYNVELVGTAPNCFPQGQNPRPVTVVAYDTTTLSFAVVCSPTTGGVRVTTSTTGTDIDPDGYHLVIGDDYYYPYYSNPIGVNTSVTVPNIPIGTQPVILYAVANNCRISGDSYRTVTVIGGGTVDVRFDVDCLPLVNLQVSTVTSGVDVVSRTYNLLLSNEFGSVGLSVAENGTVVGRLAQGRYELKLFGLAPNCEVNGQNPDSIDVSGASSHVTIQVGCSTATRLAHVRGSAGGAEIYTVKSNGLGSLRLTTNSASDQEPDWSPDGARLVFTSDRTGNRDVFVMNADGSSPQQLTTSTQADYQPTWSPDGTRIAFVSRRDGNAEIYVMNADGSNPVRLTNSTASEEQPAWSPDGSRIAFRRDSNGNGDIYVMSSTGTGVVPLTQDATDDSEPAWSPDGAVIAFARAYATCAHCTNLYSVRADGSAPISLMFWGDATQPAWSPTGRRIAFTARQCDYYDCQLLVAIARPDGNDWMTITPPGAYGPAWER